MVYFTWVLSKSGRDKMGLHFYSATLSDAVFLNLVMAVLTVTAAAVLKKMKKKTLSRMSAVI